MMFEIRGKVALVTGGASGIGYQIVKELFQHGLRACCIADVNEAFGREAIETVNQEFGTNKAIFVRTDVADKKQFEAAFEATVAQFKNVDILVNNAGIFDDSKWERELQVNVQGVTNGILIGLENYLQTYRSSSESVILNISSIVAIDSFNSIPLYTASKYAVLGLTRSFGAAQHYERTKVKVIAMCPGLTKTPLLSLEGTQSKYLNLHYRSIALDDTEGLPRQEPELVGKAAAFVIKTGEPRSVWVVEGDEPPYELNFPTRKELMKQI